MTFDDGILKIYRVENSASKGDKPREALVYKSSYYYGNENLGIIRYYTAKEHNQSIESVVCIYRDQDIKIKDIVDLEDEMFMRIEMVQHTTDEDGIKITKLTLARWNNEHNLQIKES